MKKLLILSILLVAPALQLQANCCSSGPLKPCEWSFTFRGGIEPGYYASRSDNDFIDTVAFTEVDAIGEVVEIETALVLQSSNVRTPRYDSQVQMPWTLIGDLAFAISCNTEIFIDGLYGEARGKSTGYDLVFGAIPSNLDPTFPDVRAEETYTVREDYSTFSYVGGNIGLRHYFSSGGCGSLFIGAKVGARHYDPLHVEINASNSDGAFEPISKVYYSSYNVFSGGLQIGYDIRICDCMHFVVMGELIGNCALRPHKPGYLVSEGETTTVGEGVDLLQQYVSSVAIPGRRTGTLLTLPITAGVKITF